MPPLEPWQAHAWQRAGDVPPLTRLHRVGAAGLPCGTIKGGGLRCNAAELLAVLDRAPLSDDAPPWQLGRPLRAYPAQLDLFPAQ